MVLANELISFAAQYTKAKPDVWGATPAIDISKLKQEDRDTFNSLPRNPAVVSPAVLAQKSLPELNPQWISAIEKGWQKNVAE